MAEQEKEKRGLWSRRDFFTRLGWGGFGIFGQVHVIAILEGSPQAFPLSLLVIDN